MTRQAIIFAAVFFVFERAGLFSQIGYESDRQVALSVAVLAGFIFLYLSVAVWAEPPDKQTK